jgi:multiple sugar transport system substrate-binding protein
MTGRLTHLLLTLAAAVVGSLAGCASEEDGEKIIVRVANWGSPAVESSFMTLERELWREFEELHPGVRVQVEQIPGFGQYAPKLVMMHLSGSMPDVIHLDASSGALFMNNGVVRDLTPFIENDPDFHLDVYFESVIDIFRQDDKLLAIPLDFTPMVMYYNKALFDAANVPYPKPGWTWDEFLDAAQRLTIRPDPGKPPQQYGFNFDNVMPFWVLWLWTNGGDVLSPEGDRALGHFDGPQSLGALQFLVDLSFKYRVAPTLPERDALGLDPFLEGRAAMDLKGHWMMIDYKARKLDVGIVPLPTNGGVEPTTVVYEVGLAIPTKAKHPELAWEYIKYFTSEAVQARRVVSGIAVSGNKKAAAHFAGDPVEDEFLRIVEYARPPWGARVERYEVCEDLGREMMQDIHYGTNQADISAAVHETAALMDAAVKVP